MGNGLDFGQHGKIQLKVFFSVGKSDRVCTVTFKGFTSEWVRRERPEYLPLEQGHSRSMSFMCVNWIRDKYGKTSLKPAMEFSDR